MNNWNATIGTLRIAPRKDAAMPEKMARHEFAMLCDHAANNAMAATVILWHNGEPVAEFDGSGEPAKFLRYCLARVHLGEFWQRLAGSVRKAGTL